MALCIHAQAPLKSRYQLHVRALVYGDGRRVLLLYDHVAKDFIQFLLGFLFGLQQEKVLQKGLGGGEIELQERGEIVSLNLLSFFVSNHTQASPRLEYILDLPSLIPLLKFQPWNARRVFGQHGLYQLLHLCPALFDVFPDQVIFAELLGMRQNVARRDLQSPHLALAFGALRLKPAMLTPFAGGARRIGFVYLTKDAQDFLASGIQGSTIITRNGDLAFGPGLDQGDEYFFGIGVERVQEHSEDHQLHVLIRLFVLSKQGLEVHDAGFLGGNTIKPRGINLAGHYSFKVFQEPETLLPDIEGAVHVLFHELLFEPLTHLKRLALFVRQLHILAFQCTVDEVAMLGVFVLAFRRRNAFLSQIRAVAMGVSAEGGGGG